MDESNLVLIVTGIIAAAGGWISNVITNRPKNEENTMGKINAIFEQYEKMYEKCEEKNTRMCSENQLLRDKYREERNENKELRKQLEESKKGGE